MSDRSVLVASNYYPGVAQGQTYAFSEVIRSVEGADVLAPTAPSFKKGWALRPTMEYLLGETFHRSTSVLRNKAGLKRLPTMQPVQLEKDYDLFFFMCQFPLDLSALDRIHGWRERSGKAVAFLTETWSHYLPTTKPELKLLDKFDHVFLLNAASIPNVAKYTSTPCSFLATAADCLLSTPFPNPPERTVDVYSMGRRSTAAHEQLLGLARADPSFFYVYDTIKHGVATDWAESRLLGASFIKRCKFFTAYNHYAVDLQSGHQKDFQERALATRYFEGAAGGAVMLGSPVDTPEFRRFFDWEDALIEIPADPEDMGAILADLNAQPERLRRASITNAVQSLRRHDWAYRWDEILKTLGLGRSSLLQERLHTLEALAGAAEAEAIANGVLKHEHPRPH